MKILTLIRAIGGVLARKTFMPIALVFGIISVVLLALVSVLASFIADWIWWFMIPVGFFVLVGTVLLVIVWLILQAITPNMNRTQRKEVLAFTEKLQGLAELAGTPKVVLLYRIITDIISPKKSGFISQTVTSTADIKRDFERLLKNIGDSNQKISK